ncbi:MAG: hypothetical protein ACRBFS_00195 [Aureispira sp.]
MNIINKYGILIAVKKIDAHTILLKFSKEQYFDLGQDVYELTLHGKRMGERVSSMEEFLNWPLAIVQDGKSFDFYEEDISFINQDWSTGMGFPVEAYEEQFTTKTPKDWENQFLHLVRYQVKKKAFRSITGKEFRNQQSTALKEEIKRSPLPPSVKIQLNVLLEKIQGLDTGHFHNVFMQGAQLS